jgi:hypothetical protein
MFSWFIFMIMMSGVFLMQTPWLALLPAVAFAGLAHWRKGFLIWSAAVLWALYLPYELADQWRLICSSECSIRIDLLLIYPLLWLASLLALLAALPWHLLRKKT